MPLEEQFYDQLSQRLNRQDDCLERIEANQGKLETLINSHEVTQASHRAKYDSTLYWMKWVIGGLWSAVGAVVALLFNHK